MFSGLIWFVFSIFISLSVLSVGKIEAQSIFFVVLSVSISPPSAARSASEISLHIFFSLGKLSPVYYLCGWVIHRLRRIYLTIFRTQLAFFGLVVLKKNIYFQYRYSNIGTYVNFLSFLFCWIQNRTTSLSFFSFIFIRFGISWKFYFSLRSINCMVSLHLIGLLKKPNWNSLENINSLRLGKISESLNWSFLNQNLSKCVRIAHFKNLFHPRSLWVFISWRYLSLVLRWCTWVPLLPLGLLRLQSLLLQPFYEGLISLNHREINR